MTISGDGQLVVGGETGCGDMHGKDLPSVIWRTGIKLIDELRIVPFVFSEFKSVWSVVLSSISSVSFLQA